MVSAIIRFKKAKEEKQGWEKSIEKQIQDILK
jgi:hypothetical protein